MPDVAICHVTVVISKRPLKINQLGISRDSIDRELLMTQDASYALRIYERLTTALHRSLLTIFLFVASIGLANAGVESDFYIFTH